MASIKISELNPLEKAEKEDLLVIVDSSENETKKIAIEDLNIGSTDVVISEEQPEGEDWKIWIDSGEAGNLGSEVYIGSQPTGEKLWITPPSKNLCNMERYKDTYTAGKQINDKNYYLNMTSDGGVGSGITANIISSNSVSVTGSYVQGIGFPIRCLPNTEYTIKCTKDDNIARFGYSFYTVDGTYISGTSGVDTSFTITTPSNAYWLVVLCLVSGSSSATKTFSNIMVNEQNLPYEPYKIPSIKANVNGVYETIYIGG